MSRTGEKGIVGVVFPVSAAHFARILSGRNVFCKFTMSGLRGIKPGNLVVFYQSGGERLLVGEARIDSVEWLTAQEVIEKHKDRLFLDQAELEKYTQSRWASPRPPRRKLLVLVLNSARRYDSPSRTEKPITPSGQLLTPEMYRNMKLGIA